MYVILTGVLEEAKFFGLTSLMETLEDIIQVCQNDRAMSLNTWFVHLSVFFIGKKSKRYLGH